MVIANLISYFLFVLAVGYYFITNLQWYSYKLDRVIFHHTKQWWHIVYFVIPFTLYIYISYISEYGFVVSGIYLVALYLWYRGLDKPLVWTSRVKRFYMVLATFAIFISIVFGYHTVIVPILLAYLISMFMERMLFLGFQKRAKAKIDSMEDMIVIGITASYGKTSIKNYIEHLLAKKYKTYATPRSVNTLGGVIRDINEELPSDTEVYVVEMGARGEGDIAEISTFVNPHYVVVGKIGPAHIEYFGSMENIRNTKMEIMLSERLKEAWIDQSAMVKPESYIHIYGAKPELDLANTPTVPEYVVDEVESTLDGTSFRVDGARYSATVLGAFNAMNLASSVLVAKELGLEESYIQQRLKELQPVAHRLQRIDAGGKLILDDSFNGNIDGMLTSFELASTYDGRKVVITPGLVEVSDEYNIQVAQKAQEVFDLVVVTGELNYEIFKQYISDEKLLKLADKSQMEQMLLEHTKVGDLILFANDAPSFI